MSYLKKMSDAQLVQEHQQIVDTIRTLKQEEARENEPWGSPHEAKKLHRGWVALVQGDLPATRAEMRRRGLR
jgi:hypothetical protein